MTSRRWKMSWFVTCDEEDAALWKVEKSAFQGVKIDEIERLKSLLSFCKRASLSGYTKALHN